MLMDNRRTDLVTVDVSDALGASERLELRNGAHHHDLSTVIGHPDWQRGNKVAVARNSPSRLNVRQCTKRKIKK